MNRVVFDSVDTAPTKFNDEEEERKQEVLDVAGAEQLAEGDAAGIGTDQQN